MKGDKILALHLKSCLIGAVPHMNIHVGIAFLVRTKINRNGAQLQSFILHPIAI